MSRIVTPFGFHTTADEIAKGIDLHGKRAIITGGSSGIGIETARTLASLGAEVTLAVRSVESASTVVAELVRATGNDKIHVSRLNLTDRRSIRDFIDQWQGPLHILVNNAGVMALPTLERSPDGWEMQMATNYFGHFELTVGLRRSLALAGNARVVSLSSSGHLFSPVIFDDMHFRFVPYDPLVAYGQSKTATALFAVALTERWSQDGITGNAVMPGAIATNLQRHTGGLRTPRERQKSPQQGAATSILAAISPLLDGIGGRYLEDANEALTVDHRPPDYRGVAPYAIDSANAARLWDMSTALIA